MTYEYCARRRVEFAETDCAGFVHFSVFFRYMEMTEHDFYRSLGFSVFDKARGHSLGWPRVKANCDYQRPLFFEDEFNVRLLVSRKGRSSLTYLFRFERPESREILARGQLTVVCVSPNDEGVMQSTSIPDDIREKITEAPESIKAEWQQEARS